MAQSFEVDEYGVTVTRQPHQTVIGRLMSTFGGTRADQDRRISIALGDLKAIAEELGDELTIEEGRIRMSHRTVGSLPLEAAEVLGLPPLVDLTLRTDVAGVIGSPEFRFTHEWMRGGRRESVRRHGAILWTSGKGFDGMRRLPRWILDALDVSDRFQSEADLDEHWAALARFRRALDPGARMDEIDLDARHSMADFLAGLKVTLADRFSISPKEDGRFDVVPFSGEAIEEVQREGEQVGEDAAEIQDVNLRTFQDLVIARGARDAYKLGSDNYIVIDPSAAPVLRLMAKMQHADQGARVDFVRNPRRLIAEAIAEQLHKRGKLEGLSAAEEEEFIERAAEPIFIETMEYSARVVGLTIYQRPAVSLTGSETTWLPEVFGGEAAKIVENLPQRRIEKLIGQIEEAIEEGKDGVDVAGQTILANSETVIALKRRLADLRGEAPADEDESPLIDDGDEPSESGGDGEKPKPTDASGSWHGPIILETVDNLEELGWEAKVKPRTPLIGSDIPDVVRAELRPHQADSFRWMVDAWSAGLPGVLNADEQGLGKTLQAICFLAWMKENMAQREEGGRTNPVLIVAPTSLLVNWQNEVHRHLAPPALGNVIRLYGTSLGGRKREGHQGVETKSGTALLDFSELEEAIKEGRGHRYWILTTYTTLTNYQHSLGRIRFSTAVFDEIQELKNPSSMRSRAALAVNADFRLGLTGTPIENSAIDLWAIMEQLTPGLLDVLSEFRKRYGVPEEGNMKELHDLIFLGKGKLPPVGLRRMKEEVARDLPEKRRLIHPRPMPEEQAIEYEAARGKLATGTKGSALKMLHHIRSVSVHPNATVQVEDDVFVAMSARLQAVLDLLKEIRDRKERALVFIESIRIQYRFIEIIKQEFGLPAVDLINGNTSIRHRQEIVDRFQKNLKYDGGFGVLVLAPKAAGTGLTLTAATHVIHLSRWWNPAVEEQCNDRVHRIGQTLPVNVHVPMAVHPGRQHNSFDCLLHSLMVRKRRLATAALWPMGDTRDDTSKLQQMLSEDHATASGDPVKAAMIRMFERDQVPLPDQNPDGSIEYF